ncbi:MULTISPECIES: IclR family transcriptional regulator [unclassified Jeotgalibaca]|uniref:IclR family transcriptional regulator n=1 Tax=unclassified Jeotgalibaca TaxID=2621505 RepID=UPI003FD151E3
MSNGRIQSIDRAVQVLNCFTERNPEWRLTEIAEQLHVGKSTAHGIVNTLKWNGLLNQDEETQKYRLGLKLMEMGELVKKSIDVTEVAGPFIDDLCDLVEETVHLGTLVDSEVMYVDKRETQQSIRITTTIGSRIPAQNTGIGKCLLAFSSQSVLENLPDEFETFTPHSIATKAELLEELERIRQNGYGHDKEEYAKGLYCVAAPIFDYTGNVHYAVSVSGPTFRMTPGKIKMVTKLVLRTAQQISEKMGYIQKN